MYFNPKKEGNSEPQAVAVMNAGSVAVVAQDDRQSRAKQLLQLHYSMPNGLNFELTKELALECVDDILEHWLSDGELRGREYVAYNPTRNDGELGSFMINTESGLWSDFADDAKGGDLISLVKYVTGCEFQSEAAVKILEFIAGMKTDDGAPVAIRNAGHKAKAKKEFTAMMPVPENAEPRPVFFGITLGKPVATWEYRNAADQAMFYVSRFNTKPRKTMIPQTYGIDETGQASWHNKAPDAPRPAYGLNRLAARPDAPVLFTEGEKAADAAQRLFPDYVAVTTMGGAQAPEKTDFSPFADRKVYIAPDNDEAGVVYKEKLIQLLRAVGAEVVAVMRLELLIKGDTPLSVGYDLADAETAGWTADGLAELGTALWEPVPPADPTPPATTLPAAQTKQNADAPTQPKKKKTPLDFAKEFATQSYGGNIACCNNQTLAYADGYWAALNPDVDIRKPILDAMDDNASAAKVNGVHELIKIQYAVKPEMFERKSPLICLNNCTLNPETGELLPHSVKHYLTNKVDIDYAIQAQCSLWLQTLDEIFAPDADKAEKIQLLQEFIGYCLIPDTRIHKFLWMVGSGRNGKSLILAVITALIGKVNISYAQIERLGEKFVRAELQSKLVNISSEMSAQATVADGYLKQITAGDIIEAERKNERPFSFKPYARLIGATNILPRLLDHSDGFFCRAMILRFNRQFKEAEKDIHRESKLMAELPGILNWAVAGLQNLLTRGDFIIPSSSLVEVAQYRLNSDPVRQFAEDFLKPSDDSSRWVASGELYDRYKEWSVANGYKTLASNQFADRLSSALGYEKVKRNVGRFWKAEYCASNLPDVPPMRSITPLAANYNV